jgi:hypothetical protein
MPHFWQSQSAIIHLFDQKDKEVLQWLLSVYELGRSSAQSLPLPLQMKRFLKRAASIQKLQYRLLLHLYPQTSNKTPYIPAHLSSKGDVSHLF